MKLKRLAHELRFEDAARLRDRIEALEGVAREINRMQQLRELAVCVVAPGEREGSRRGFWIAKGQVVDVRPFTGTRGVEWQAGLAAVARATPTLAPEAADDLITLATFLKRPPPELEVVALAREEDLLNRASRYA
jgi:excinuclease UvrABC nuclease subunit